MSGRRAENRQGAGRQKASEGKIWAIAYVANRTAQSRTGAVIGPDDRRVAPMTTTRGCCSHVRRPQHKHRFMRWVNSCRALVTNQVFSKYTHK
ncbi:hypothetical protein ANANG_G00185060 [Anguilla anguilla]|uniref:Uncharacterized protein n=1 Tax=Anguilla anguilla TaxID=7936 RepID=A0A9D3M997_ANGAN|nr:hypothetical protein ANANG_G00185060 [Anguilla anguilla]